MIDAAEPSQASPSGVLEVAPAATQDAAQEKAASPASPGALPKAASEEIVVIDYGGQYSQLIARRVRDCGVFSELLPHTVALEEIAKRKPRGIILSGGPASVYAEGAPALGLA